VGHLEEGLLDVRKAISINPGNTLARFRVGVGLLYERRYEEALSEFNRVPRQFSPALWTYQTAWTLMNLGRTAEAA
jgi:tetratricopeptide (TPR) repeat protein